MRSWNAFEAFDQCIDSIFSQTYKKYQILFVDDCSNYTTRQRKFIRQKLTNHIVVFNRQKKGSIRNAYELIHNYAKKNSAIICNIDGDDYFSNNQALETIANAYTTTGCEYTYGNCRVRNVETGEFFTASSFDRHANKPYTQEEKNSSLRKLPFKPLHPRTWKVSLFKKIKQSNFKDANGNWLKYCEDMAIFFPLMDQAPYGGQVIQSELYTYNISTKHNDTMIHLLDTLKDEVYIRKFQGAQQKKIPPPTNY